ncbi:MAG: hypothetical protein HY602_01010 [Parcubacteria group bacterium]|nr:hypothetical protein [Parcubacteria group bacterium]
MSMIKIFLIIVFPLFFLSPFTVNAEEEAKFAMPQNIVAFLSHPILTPDSPFYFVKRIIEKIGDLITVRNISEFKRNLELATERLSEAYMLLDKGDLEKAKNAMFDFKKRLDGAGDSLQSIKNPAKRQALLDQFVEATKNYNRFFENLLPQLTINDQEEFKQAFYISDKWSAIAATLNNEIAKKLKQVGENIKNVENIEQQVENDLKSKIQN